MIQKTTFDQNVLNLACILHRPPDGFRTEFAFCGSDRNRSIRKHESSFRGLRGPTKRPVIMDLNPLQFITFMVYQSIQWTVKSHEKV
jgi:hypothetical protein